MVDVDQDINNNNDKSPRVIRPGALQLSGSFNQLNISNRHSSVGGGGGGNSGAVPAGGALSLNSVSKPSPHNRINKTSSNNILLLSP